MLLWGGWFVIDVFVVIVDGVGVVDGFFGWGEEVVL